MLLPSAPVISSTNVEKIGSYNMGLLFPSWGGGGASVTMEIFIQYCHENILCTIKPS